MPYYAVGGLQSTTSTAYKGTVAVWTVTTGIRRTKWYEVIIGATAVPNAADCAIQVDISRLLSTTSLAGTAATMSPLDTADGAAIATGLVNITTEPNAALIGNSVMNFGLNQRNTTRWIAAQESQYLVGPATNLNGFYMREQTPAGAYVGSLATQISFME
jgi:hypothetical protein